MSGTPTIKLDVFEGPLDLLLHLIKKNEVEITAIPIARITDQYLAFLEERPDLLNLDGAGEYLVMAATLTYIKSRMLLPQPVDAAEEPDEDPRAELIQRLLEYQRYREVAVALGERPVLTRDVFTRAPETPDAPPPGEPALRTVRDASLGDLLTALRDILSRRKPPRTHEVGVRQRSVADCVQDILARFVGEERVEFASLFPLDAGRGEIIAMFLAILEMIKLQVVRAEQGERFGPIELSLAVADVTEAAARVRDVGTAEAWRGGETSHDDGTRPG